MALILNELHRAFAAEASGVDMRVAPDAATVADIESAIDRYPVLDERGSDALGVVPFRRAALTEISADLETRRLALSTEIAQMKHQGATTGVVAWCSTTGGRSASCSFASASPWAGIPAAI